MSGADQQPFGVRLEAGLQHRGKLCVGLDPHPEMLTEWGLGHNQAGLEAFGARIIEAAASRVAVVKPQVAFYEAFGPEGLCALATTIRQAKEAGLLVLADAKRGDIGSTMQAYAQAWLNPASDFGVDALTVSPFLGFGSLQPAIELARHHGAGLFVLALTSNPEGREVQLAYHDDDGTGAGPVTVAEDIIRQTAAVNAIHAAQPPAGTAQGAPLGSIGLVVGATTAHLAADYGIDLTLGRPALLAPGYGAQGATAETLRRSFGPAWGQVLVNSSRQILEHGPEPRRLAAAIDSAQEDLSR
ncbi:orotidine-5'-phosphate decarboxylase [Nesterenkonia alba]|uniref:orotidine-5'-phosphate decarboxylase n=1 Tax=Nesterenkonia alba TaxID=515814 RepID=UPI0003B73934|nr:orotidine-5'-phosphate decarboxylase [Nesterenkonia alba]